MGVNGPFMLWLLVSCLMTLSVTTELLPLTEELEKILISCYLHICIEGKENHE
jgi:hypothetical protein